MKKYILILGLILGAGITVSSQITNVLNSAADLYNKTLVTAEGNRTISGTFTYSVPARFSTGSASAPGIVAGIDTTTGLLLGTGSIGFSLAGVQQGLLSGSGLTIYGNNIINNVGKIPAISSTYFASTAIPGTYSLLKANSGTDTNVAATNVDTVAITGLTANDTLVVQMTFGVVAQNVAQPQLYNSTDAVTVTNVGTGPTTLGRYIFTATVRQLQEAATAVSAYTVGTSTNTSGLISFTTNWTGAWTLALRHGGVTAGGTLQWSWAVYKLAGQ